MPKQQESHIFTGMQRDVSASRHPAQFIYDGLNIRLTAREGDTLLSVTNERGTADSKLSISGFYIGHCLLNQYLVIFSTTSTIRDTNGNALEEGDGLEENRPGKDYITRIDLGSLDRELLYGSEDPEVSSGSIGLCTANPIDAIASYESEDVQKIYWTDGFNQPRVINISPKNNGNISSYIPTSFDFIPELALEETVTVEKMFSASGEFPPGVIQYAFTYYNKYGQETNIFYTTRLYHVAFRDRGASPESKVNIAFKITVSNVDSNFEFLRIYSIQRTSLNAVPICKRIQDIDIRGIVGNDSVTYTDTGVNGDTVDPTELLYKGGEPVMAQTLEQKDNTLFLGNLTLKRESVPQVVKDTLNDLFHPKTITVGEWEDDETDNSQNVPMYSGSSYSVGEVISVDNIPYVNTIEYSGFKVGEVYRIGIQFQHKTGRWSEPVWLRDYKVLSAQGNNTSPAIYAPYINESSGELYLPQIKVSIGDSGEYKPYKAIRDSLYSAGYKRARLLMAQPTNTDRTILCQGLANPVVYSDLQRHGMADTGAAKESGNGGSLYAQSSWIFRPVTPDSSLSGDTTSVEGDGCGYIPSAGTVFDSSTLGGVIVSGTAFPSPNLRSTEIGADLGGGAFKIDTKMVTIHTPELIFDEALFNEDWSSVGISKVGDALFSSTFGDIDIQTKTPTIGSAQGFIHKTAKTLGNAALVSGLFYKDYIVDEIDTTPPQYQAYNEKDTPVSWPVFMWHRTGSLNNDVVRSGRSAELLKKRISNYHVATSFARQVPSTIDREDIQTFNSDEVTIVKVDGHIYMGNIDTALTSIAPEPKYFAADSTMNGDGIDLSSNLNWRLSLKDPSDQNSSNGAWKQTISNNSISWVRDGGAIGNKVPALCIATEPIRMKYKSTPHLVAKLDTNSSIFGSTPATLPIVELTRPYDSDVFFGGKSDDALKACVWVPISEPLPINFSEGPLNQVMVLSSDRGDTWYQRFDCLKTYPFSSDDINQVIDIASFMVETHLNIDGRYDRNRGQTSALNMTPRNFNLYNPVYSQPDNFFTYRILDSDFYENRYFPNQITWTKEKAGSADTDLWTNITLASTYDMDGSKGEVISLNTWKDQIFCFQRKGVSNILFNSRVQIPVSDGVPIEISNNYKVDGYKYISDGIGCSDRKLIKETSSGIYFVDSVGSHLFHIGESLQDMSEKCNMTTWFKDNAGTIRKLAFDDINHDLYLIQDSEGKALCLSEKLGQFTGFYDYGGIDLIETYNGHVFTLKEGSLYKMFEGDYCNLFGTNRPWYLTFISNGGNMAALDKTFTNLEFRACVEGDGTVSQETGRFTPALPFDSLEVWNEHQHGIAALNIRNSRNAFLHHQEGGEASLKRRFRIWRCDIPRNNAPLSYDAGLPNIYRKVYRPSDRMRNPWLYVKIKGSVPSSGYMNRVELHDVVVSFFV